MLRGILCSLSYNFQQIRIAQIAALQHESPLFVLGILDFFGSRTFFFFLISSRAFCNASISFLFLEVVVANGAMAAKLSVLALAFSAFFSLVFFSMFTRSNLGDCTTPIHGRSWAGPGERG